MTVDMRYREFLQYCKDNPGAHRPPAKDVDEYWHAQILDTKKYREDCLKFFGYFLDHVPAEDGCYCNDDIYVQQ